MKTYISKVVRELYPELVGKENAIMKYYEENKISINKKIEKLGVNVEYLTVKVKSRGGSSQKGGNIYIYLVASLVICGLFYKLETIKDQVKKLQNTASNARDASLRSMGATRSLIQSLAENKEKQTSSEEDGGIAGTVVTRGWRKRSKTPTRNNTGPKGKKLGTIRSTVSRQRTRSRSPGAVAFLKRRRDIIGEKAKYNTAMENVAHARHMGRSPSQSDLEIIRTYNSKRRGGKKTKKRKNTNKRRKNTRRRKKRAGHHPGWDF